MRAKTSPTLLNPQSWQSFFRRQAPALLALLALGGIYAVLSREMTIGPRWLLIGLIAMLLIPLVFSLRRGLWRRSRAIGIVILIVVTLAEAASTVFLVTNLIAGGRISDTPHDMALVLLRDAGLIWLFNVLTFALWYWEIDAGGPGIRHREGYHSSDFVFPQLTMQRPEQAAWGPHFIDYLFLAFNTSTAFSPTDTLVLSPRAKLLMMTQSLISLAVLAIIAARAINTL